MIPAHSGPVVRQVAASVLVAIAVAASMLALTTIVLPGSWVTTGLVGIVLVSTTTCVVRLYVDARAARRRTMEAGGSGGSGRAANDPGSGSVVPTLAGAVVAAWYALARFGSAVGGFDVFVGTEHVGRLFERLGEAGEIIRSEVAPVPGSLPLTVLTVGGTFLVLLLADALACGLRRPAATGAPLLALWCPPLVIAGRVPWGVFFVTVTALLLLLTLDGPIGARARRRAERPDADVRRAERARSLVTGATAASVAIVAMGVGSVSAGLPSFAGTWYRAFTTTGDTIRLSEDLDILRSLTERSNDVVLGYVIDAEQNVGPFRSYTATTFDGRRWSRGADRTGRDFDGSRLLWPEEPGTGLGEPRSVTVTVGELRDDKLPLPVEPRSLAVEGGWGYDAARDEVVGGRTEAGQVYELDVRERDLTPQLLREAGIADIDDVYTELPDTARIDDVEREARDVVGTAATPYDQAVALQSWFRDPGNFTYATTIPRGGTGDPVWDFLQHRTGYCLQFATTMVVMARSLDIPARLAVGHLPGTAVDDGTWEIRGQDSHAWPELYFPDAGWVRFEPTPATQTGVAPRYTNPNLGQGAPAPVPPVQEGPTREPVQRSPGATQSAAPAPSGVGSGTDDRLPVWAWGLAGGIGVLVVVGAVLLVVRRRTVAPLLDPERAWQQVVATLTESGVELPPPTTLRRAPEIIAAQVESRSGTPLPEDVLEDLVALADAAESARYARSPQVHSPGELESLAASVTSGLTTGLAAR